MASNSRAESPTMTTKTRLKITPRSRHSRNASKTFYKPFSSPERGKDIPRSQTCVSTNPGAIYNHLASSIKQHCQTHSHPVNIETYVASGVSRWLASHAQCSGPEAQRRLSTPASSHMTRMAEVPEPCGSWRVVGIGPVQRPTYDVQADAEQNRIKRPPFRGR